LTRLAAIPRALANRNFGIYVAGSSVSLIGNWMQRIGVGWLAWELSHSGAILGLVAFADLCPTIALGPFGGALADRFDRLRMMRIAQSLVMLQALSLFVLTASGLITVELLIGLVLLGGLVDGLNQPARLALVPSLVPRSDLATAVAINSIVFNLARFVGPALAGLVIVWWGVSTVFAVNALSFLAFLFALAKLRLPPLALEGQGRRSMLGAIGEGLRYTANHAGIGPLLLLHAILAVSARPFFELLPGFASGVFGRGASGLAMLGSAVGIGAVAGGLWLAQRHDQSHLTNVALGSSFLVTLSVLTFALSTWFSVAIVCMALAGFGMVVAGVGTQTLLQASVEEAMRGRVLSLFGLIFRGGPALGALLMGAASELLGLQAPVAAGTIIGLIASILIWRQRDAIAEHLGERPVSSPA
jgi:predicted MFS family arabinose efflux permease